MDDLIGWLKLQLDEDERPERWHESGCWGGADCECAVRARMLREVEAKRLMLKGHEPVAWPTPDEEGYRCAGHEWVAWPCRTVRLVALPFADRPGYREEWRP